ncbi:Hypothetical predicted protein [Podarcis lilfordi]|uniref:Uncharacterized protein n=1 Tax=Podarcis lilfordi TaxID=74358 RepID=A0AA35JL11_9SAUR|nr:Hypothetical predicted protein [Podarcis lilfordi]
MEVQSQLRPRVRFGLQSIPERLDPVEAARTAAAKFIENSGEKDPTVPRRMQHTSCFEGTPPRTMTLEWTSVSWRQRAQNDPTSQV